jgi:molybdenum cofactor cytidylyltransferase
MFALAAELPGRVIITTTTRIFAAQIARAPAVVFADDLSRLDDYLAAHGRCLVIGRVDGDKAVGVDPNLPARLLARPGVDHVLVEADGSRMRPVKAPADHEPVVPPGTTLLVPVAGLDALDGPLDAIAHRPERIRAIANGEDWLTAEGHLTPTGLGRLMTHPSGGLKNTPTAARIVPFLNKVETDGKLAAAREAARLILADPSLDRVVVGALHVPEPVREVWRRVAAVVLAAGESRRMGRNKLLLPWSDTTVLGRTLDNVTAAGVFETVIVTGHERESVIRIVTPSGLPTIHNTDYANGMLSSVQAAVRQLPPHVSAALVVLGDQPMVPPAVLDRLLSAYAATPRGLVAPTFNGRRGNPVLIDRRHFAELLALPAEAAPRVLLQNHRDDVLSVAVNSEAILHDLDQPQEYERHRPKS